MNSLIYNLIGMKNNSKTYCPGVFVDYFHREKKRSGIILKILPGNRYDILSDEGIVHEIHSWCIIGKEGI